MQWQTLYWNQQSAILWTSEWVVTWVGSCTLNFMPFKTSLANCKHPSLLLLCLLLYQRKYKYIKTLATEVPSCKPICIILQIREPWILHSFADSVSVLIGYSTGFSFTVSGFQRFEGTQRLYLQLYIVDSWTQWFHLQKSGADRSLWQQYISSKRQINFILWLRLMFYTNWVHRLGIDKRKFKKRNNIYLVNIWVQAEMVNPSKENEST